MISIDCGAIVDGWHGDAAMTVAVGEYPSRRTRADGRHRGSRCGAAFGAARLGGRVSDISHAVESYVRAQPHPTGGTSASWRTTPVTGSARRCTSRRTCPTTAGPAGARLERGLALAVDPMVWWGASTHSRRRRVDGRHRRQLAGGALRAHVHADPARSLGPDRPRRGQGQARRARGPVRRRLSWVRREAVPAALHPPRARSRGERVRVCSCGSPVWPRTSCHSSISPGVSSQTSTSMSGPASCSVGVRGTPVTIQRPSRRRSCGPRHPSRHFSTRSSPATSRSSGPASASAPSVCTRAGWSTAAGRSRSARCR